MNVLFQHSEGSVQSSPMGSSTDADCQDPVERDSRKLCGPSHCLQASPGHTRASFG